MISVRDAINHPPIRHTVPRQSIGDSQINNTPSPGMVAGKRPGIVMVEVELRHKVLQLNAPSRVGGIVPIGVSSIQVTRQHNGQAM